MGRKVGAAAVSFKPNTVMRLAKCPSLAHQRLGVRMEGSFLPSLNFLFDARP
jgi:hypothetical protein